MAKKSRVLFLKSFVLSLAAVFTIGLLFLFGGQKKEAVDISSASTPERVYTARSDDKFTVFLTLARKPIEPPYAYFLIRFNAPENEISVIRLPSKLSLSNEGESKKILSEEFARGGGVATESAIEKYFGAQISSQIFLSSDTLSEFLGLFNLVKIDVPQNLSQIDRERDIYIKMDKGPALLSSSGFVDYLCCTAFEGGEVQALYEGAKLVCQFLKQNGAEFFKNGGAEYILGECDTDISALRMENRREMLEFLFSKAKISAVKLGGESRNMDTEFVLTEDCRSEISGILKR